MAVVSTDKWLDEFVSARKSTRKDERTSLQCSILCGRLVKLFRDGLPEEIHYTLQQQGLFLPHEEVDIEKLKRQKYGPVYSRSSYTYRGNGKAHQYQFIFSPLLSSKR